MYYWHVLLPTGYWLALLPFFSEKTSLVSEPVTFFSEISLPRFSVSFHRLFHRAREENTWRGKAKAFLYTPPWARASAKFFQSLCYAWLFNQKTGSWVSACRDHLKSITMLLFWYVITAVNWQQKHFSCTSRGVNVLVIGFERIVGYEKRLTTSKWSHQT